MTPKSDVKVKKLRKPSTSRPLLLENRDNTICYLNSALNLLYTIKDIRHYLATGDLKNDFILKEIKSIFNGKRSARKLVNLLNMRHGAQSCHEVVKKIVHLLPPDIQLSLSLQHQKMTQCEKCGEKLLPRKKMVQSVEILLPEDKPYTLKKLLTNQSTPRSCTKYREVQEVFDVYRVTVDSKTMIVNVLQSDPMEIKNLDTDGVMEVFGGRWVLRAAIIYLPDTNPKYDYGENGHSISWTKYGQKWFRVSDDKSEEFEKFDASRLDVEMMVFERV
ncbi:hypothetical protein CRE_23483 [Caenorhabditis remanei]|uniref:USP domain-containing protein n=1 Tax=Caenorhabditis remanei TaxID=31234 RepID=E3MGZ2_CAERE|nr:hypothetical protein CRE_23483 [Caenorhabditis remanei]